MIKYILSLGLLITGLHSYSQGCNELFISEYVEGWSNNKAIELYNPTNAAIDLSAYKLERYSNGSASAAENQKLTLEGMIEPQSTFVIVLDKRDPDGTGQEAPVWEELQAAADWFACPVYDTNNAMYFNGNDAMVLRKIAGNVVIDVFGKIGEDPGDPNDGGGWNNVAPEYSWALNGAVAWSANHTLVRKSSVVTGDVNPVDGFNVSTEYDSLLVNTFTNLGIHASVCNPDFVAENTSLEINLFPNPSTSGKFSVTSPLKLSKIEVISLEGKIMLREDLADFKAELSTAQIPAGVYIVHCYSADGILFQEKLVIR
jgi:hypothetical protein